MYDNITKFISEKLRINKDLDVSDKIDEKDFEAWVYTAKGAASEKGLEVKFRNKETSAGDFCFFIYDKSKQNRYLVGYDGYWGFENSFQRCYEATMEFIENYEG